MCFSAVYKIVTQEEHTYSTSPQKQVTWTGAVELHKGKITKTTKFDQFQIWQSVISDAASKSAHVRHFEIFKAAVSRIIFRTLNSSVNREEVTGVKRSPHIFFYKLGVMNENIKLVNL